MLGETTSDPPSLLRPGAVARRRQRRASLVLAVTTGALLALAGIVVLRAYAAARDIVYPSRGPVEPRPAAFGLSYQDVSFVTADGITLRGWYVPPRGPGRAALLVTPGYGDDRGKAITATAMLADHGYGVLTFDWRAVGESGGEMSTIGFDEAQDVLAASDWLQRQPEVDPGRIGALSRSAGAAALIRAAAADPAIRAVVAETTFASLPDMIRTGVEAKTGLPAFPFAPLIVFFGERMTGRHIGDLRPVDAIGRLAPRPVLIIRAGKDIWVPAHDADLLYARAGEPKELWDAPNAEHAQVQRAYPAEYERRVAGFFDRYLK